PPLLRLPPLLPGPTGPPPPPTYPPPPPPPPPTIGGCRDGQPLLPGGRLTSPPPPKPGRGPIIGPPPGIGLPPNPPMCPKPPMPNAAAEYDPATQQAIRSKPPSNSARIDRELIALFRMANSRCGVVLSLGRGDEAYD